MLGNTSVPALSALLRDHIPVVMAGGASLFWEARPLGYVFVFSPPDPIYWGKCFAQVQDNAPTDAMQVN